MEYTIKMRMTALYEDGMEVPITKESLEKQLKELTGIDIITPSALVLLEARLVEELKKDLESDPKFSRVSASIKIEDEIDKEKDLTKELDDAFDKLFENNQENTDV